MNTDSYFDYIGILRLNDNKLTFNTLISYLHGGCIPEAQLRRARAQVLRLDSVGLVTISGGPNWEEQTVTLTGAGETIADMIAYLRSDSMLRQCTATA